MQGYIGELLVARAILPVPRHKLGQIPPLFLVPEASGGFGPVFDLKVLNSYMKVPPFKMESLETIILVAESGDWMVSLDLADAYLHVSIDASHHHFLRPSMEGSYFHF